MRGDRVGEREWNHDQLGSKDKARGAVVPFRGEDECLRWLRYPAPPNRRRRLERFAEAYGLTSTDGLVDQVIAVQRASLDLVRRLAAEGHERQLAMVQAGALDEIRRRIAWSEQNRGLF